MQEFLKAFANVIVADLEMKLQTWQNSKSLRKQVFAT